MVVVKVEFATLVFATVKRALVVKIAQYLILIIMKWYINLSALIAVVVMAYARTTL